MRIKALWVAVGTLILIAGLTGIAGFLLRQPFRDVVGNLLLNIAAELFGAGLVVAAACGFASCDAALPLLRFIQRLREQRALEPETARAAVVAVAHLLPTSGLSKSRDSSAAVWPSQA